MVDIKRELTVLIVIVLINEIPTQIAFKIMLNLELCQYQNSPVGTEHLNAKTTTKGMGGTYIDFWIKPLEGT